MARLKLGTRASLLAQTQSRQVAGLLMQTNPGLRVELVLIATSGDKLSSPSFAKAPEGKPAEASAEAGGLKAMFTKELEEALLDNRIDLAVHSLKDMAAHLPAGLELACVPEREDPREAWISPSGVPFPSLRPGARVATGSVRRQAQLKHIRPDLEIVPMRGNVDTRLRTLREQRYDGMILAAAGLRRLGRASEITGYFQVDEMIPAVGQGCLAIEIRSRDVATAERVRRIDHAPSRAAARAERAFLQAIGGDCHTPIAAHAVVCGDRLELSAWIWSADGRAMAGRETGPGSRPEAVGQTAARHLLDQGAKIC